MTQGSIDAQLRAAVGRIARVPQLLVACDYDGTLAPIVEDPTQARPAAGIGRGRPGARRAAADDRRGRLRPGAARPGRAVPAAQRGAPRRQPRLRVRHRLRRALAPELRRGAHPAAERAARDRGRQGPAYGWRANRPAWPCTCARPTGTVADRVAEAIRARPGDVAGDHRHPGQGGRRALGDAHPQGHSRSTSCAPSSRRARCSSSATTSPTRTRSPTCTARTSASRSGPARPRAAYRVADPLEAARVLGAAAGDPPQLAVRRARGADRAALDAGQRPYGRAAHPRGQGDLAVPPAPGLGGDLRRPARRQPGRPLHASRPTGAACRWASATGPAR